MKFYPTRSKKFLILLLNGILVILLLFALIGCSSGTDNSQVSSSPSEIDQLKEENEKLREQLEAATANVETAKPQNEDPEFVLPQVNIVPSERALSDLLIGEWFLPKFYEVTEVDNYIISLQFNTNGTGIQRQTLYLPSYLDSDNYSTTDPIGEVTYDFSWSLNGNTVHTVFGSDFVDYTFSSEQQQLLVISQNGEKPKNEHIYGREKPSVPEKYVEKNLIIGNIQAQKASLMRRFLGIWYFDVFTWVFSDDGTGIIDIPELGDQPATKREFTYEISGDTADMMMTVEWSDSRTSFFWPVMNADGSITLQGSSDTQAIILTRTFDVDNCPVSEAIISNQMGVFTGSIFSEILPEL